MIIVTRRVIQHIECLLLMMSNIRIVRQCTTHSRDSLALAMLQIYKARLCHETVVDISQRAMCIVRLLGRRCQLKVVFEAKREIRLSDEDELVPIRAHDNCKWDQTWFY
jgi:hypothetical protein